MNIQYYSAHINCTRMKSKPNRVWNSTKMLLVILHMCMWWIYVHQYWFPREMNYYANISKYESNIHVKWILLLFVVSMNNVYSPRINNIFYILVRVPIKRCWCVPHDLSGTGKSHRQPLLVAKMWVRGISLSSIRRYGAGPDLPEEWCCRCDEAAINAVTSIAHGNVR